MSRGNHSDFFLKTEDKIGIFDYDFANDEDDESYNVLEDILKSKYSPDEEEYSANIPKKEVKDVNEDMNEMLINDNFSELNNSLISKISKNKTQNSKLNYSYSDDNKKLNKKRKRIKKIKENYMNLNQNLNLSNVSENLFINKTEQKEEEDKNNFFKQHINEEIEAINQMNIFEQISFVLKQYDLMIQLLMQNLLMIENKHLKLKCYSMLFSFYIAKLRVSENLNLPEFNIKFNFNQTIWETYDKKKCNDMNLKLQLSFFQPPILEVFPLIIKLAKNNTFSKEDTKKILKEFFPFVNPLFFPITNKFRHGTYFSNIQYENNRNIQLNENDNFSNKRKNRRKFDSIDDNLLLIGLKIHGKKNINAIQQLWLPMRTVEEIKHRIKNLTCQNAPNNIIKKFKLLNESMLSEDEFFLFIKGIEWFGFKNKWNLISRYFLPERNSDYLESFFNILVEKKVFTNEILGNGFIDINCSNKNNCNKKCSIQICEDVIKKYKLKFKNDIEKIELETNDINLKNYFYSQDIPYEKINTIQIKNKKEENFSRMNTRNKGKELNNDNIKNPNQNNINYKNKGKNNVDFQLSNFDDGTFEKIEL